MTRTGVKRELLSDEFRMYQKRIAQDPNYLIDLSTIDELEEDASLFYRKDKKSQNIFNLLLDQFERHNSSVIYNQASKLLAHEIKAKVEYLHFQKRCFLVFGLLSLTLVAYNLTK